MRYSFYPVIFHAEDKFAVRDAGARRDLGVFTVAFTAEVDGHDARIFRLMPLASSREVRGARFSNID